MLLKRLLPLLPVLLLPAFLSAQEICNNGIDDDGDGLIDLNDPDCVCSTLVSPPDLDSYIHNHSFEDRMCCPLGFVNPFSPPWLSCADGWLQATTATTDYFHMCGYHPAGMPMPPPDGEGAVGFFVMHGYKEFVGTCLTWPLPATPMLAGTTYTLSMWVAGSATDSYHSQSLEQGQQFSNLWTDDVPLAIFGMPNVCVEFPMSGPDCMEDYPGWVELGRTYVKPAWQWQRVSITFTPTQDIHSIVIGAACDIPTSFAARQYVDSQGDTVLLQPYALIDELLLTLASDQVLLPVSATGSLCTEDVLVTGQPPAGATDYQWYLDGVALAGETGQTVDVSAGGYGPGIYTLACTFNSECLMGSTSVSPANPPIPLIALEPATGCAPLQVAFADTTGGTEIVLWNLGDGTTSTDSAFIHTYGVPGIYDVYLRVRDGAGCEGEITLTHAITVFPGVTGQITATPNPVDAEDPSVVLTGSGTGDIISWWWDLGVAEPPGSTDPTVAATFPEEPGDYPVILVVSSPNGCVDTVHSMVTVIDPGEIVMPNVFSPNNDGHNDRFIPIDYKGAPGLMEIYNRWGQVIFSTRNLAQGWNGSGAPAGTYYYIVVPDEPGTETLTGHVTLLR